MTIRSIIAATTTAVAIAMATPAAAHGIGESVAPHFAQTIPNIAGKSLVALIVDYAPGGASTSHVHAKSAFVFAYVLSGEIESQVNGGPSGSIAPAKVSTRRRAPVIRSAATQARASQPGCSRCSSSIAAKRS